MTNITPEQQMVIKSQLKSIVTMFNNTSTDIYSASSMNEIAKLESIKFITSLSLIKYDDKARKGNKETQDIIVSTCLYVGDLGVSEIFDSLKTRYLDLAVIYLIVVSWESFYNSNSEVIKKEYIGTDLGDRPFKLIVYTMDYKTFFKDVININKTCKLDIEKKIIGLNPIIIFQGLHWGLILYLFQLNNFTVHGGSTTRRHKLSISEYKLAKFLDLIDYSDQSVFYNLYIDKNISSNRYDEKYYNHIKSNNNKDFSHENTYIKNYFKLNDIIYYEAKLLALDKKILEKETSIKKLVSRKESLELSVNPVDHAEENLIRLKNSDYKKKIDSSTSQDQKASYKGRIKKNVERLTEIRKEKEDKRNELNKLPSVLSTSSLELNKLNEEKETIKQKLFFIVNDGKDKTEGRTILNKNDIENKQGAIVSLPQGGRVPSAGPMTIKRSYSTNVPIRKVNFYIDSPSYLELQRIFNSYPLDNQTQIKIETFLINQGSLLLKDRLNQNLDINYYKINSNLINIIKTSLDDLELLLKNLKKNIRLQLEQKQKKEFLNETFELLSNIENETLISYMLGRFLKIISNNNMLNNNTYCSNISIDLSKDLVNFYILNEFKKIKNSDNDSLSKFINENKKRFQVFENEIFLFNFGMSLFDLLLEVKLIDMEVIQSDRETKHTVFIPNKIISDKIENNFFLDLPYKIPMIVKPKEYGRDLETGNEILGGYLLNDKDLVTPLIIKNPELRDQSVIDNNNILFDMVNNISSVAFKINQQVLDFIMEYGLEYNLIIDPNYNHPLETIKNNKKLRLSEKKQLDSFLSKKYLEMNILGLAHIFKNIPEFFIPVRIDNRGRVYCVADYLNYQSTELAKSLLIFSKGEKIYKNDQTAIDYLKIFGANCFGNGFDKKSYNDRVEWVNNNEENILNFKNGILINQADSKLLFIAFCFEYLNYKNSLNNNNTYFISHFPIQLDATCNGYQHLSLLTGDDPLAAELNLVPATNQDIPKDFYTFVAMKLTNFFKKKILEIKESDMLGMSHPDGDKLENYEKLLKLNINRKLVKAPIMVKPYNASLLQMENYIKESFDEIWENKKKFYVLKAATPGIKYTNEDLNILTETINKIIYVEFPKLKVINSYLKRVAEICSILNITIVWALPSGLNVNQYYENSEAIRLKPFAYKKNTFKLLIGNKKLNKAKQIRALMPNLIHSLDATSLALLIENLFKLSHSEFKNFYSIHDCFAVTGNNIENMIHIIKLVYIQIYSDNNYLRKFDEGIINSIKLHFGKEAFNDVTKHIKVNGFDLNYPDIESVITGNIDKSNILKSQYLIN